MPGSFFVPYSANAWEAVGPGVHGAFREHGVPMTWRTTPALRVFIDHLCARLFPAILGGVSWASRLKEAPLCIDLLHNTPRTVLLRMLNV